MWCLKNLLLTLYTRDGNLQNTRAPGRAFKSTILSQMCGGKKRLFFYLLVRSHMVLLISSLWVDLVITWKCFLENLGSCGLWEGLGTWGEISFIVHINPEKEINQESRIHNGLQMLWLEFPVFLMHCSDPGRKDPLFLFFADCLSCLWQMIYSCTDLGQCLQHRLFALNLIGGDGQCWSILEAATETGSNWFFIRREAYYLDWSTFVYGPRRAGSVSCIYITGRLMCVCRCALKARDWGTWIVVQSQKYSLAHFLLSAKNFEITR